MVNVSHPPPPKRQVYPTPPPSPAVSAGSSGEKETWKAWTKRKSSGWGQTAMVKSVVWSDKAGGTFNGWAETIGSERFWPTTGDFPIEMEKCARILRAFTVDGIEHTVEEKSVKGLKKQRRVMKKIPSRIIRSAKGLAIFTSMRSGMAPFGGAGGAGVVVAKLPDGTWSAPAAMSPNNATAGLMFGVDIYDAVLVIRTQSALESFSSHKITVGTELAVAAGPYGGGAAAELGLEKSPVLSYMRSRGLYAGLEAVGQIFIERIEENEKQYWWPGIRAGNILRGEVAVPIEAASLMKALTDAETGRAQRMKGLENEFEEPFPEIPLDIELAEGEVLRLPPTPGQTIKEEEEEELLLQLAEAKRLRLEKLYPVRLDNLGVEPADEKKDPTDWNLAELEEAEREEAERELRVSEMEAQEDRQNKLEAKALEEEEEEEEEKRRQFNLKEEAKRLA
ncbi:SH3 domain-containing YSC84-like protein 1, partial [Phenoliferia sp. Uapishka_3]